jgi:hypothetical protein
LASIPPAIQRFYETLMAMQKDSVDAQGILHNYPETVVAFAVNPGFPLNHEYLRPASAGTAQNSHLKVQYSNPRIADQRWLDIETARYNAIHGNNAVSPGYHHSWRWPDKKAEPKEETRLQPSLAVSTAAI